MNEIKNIEESLYNIIETSQRIIPKLSISTSKNINVFHRASDYFPSYYDLDEVFLERNQKGINLFIDVEGKSFLIDSNFPINASYDEMKKKLDEYLRKLTSIMKEKYGFTVVKVQEDLGMGNYMNVPGARGIRKVWFIYRNKKKEEEIKVVYFYFLKEEEDGLNRKIVK